MIEELDQLKDIHGRKFDVQTKQRLHETIFEGLNFFAIFRHFH